MKAESIPPIDFCNHCEKVKATTAILLKADRTGDREFMIVCDKCFMDNYLGQVTIVGKVE